MATFVERFSDLRGRKGSSYLEIANEIGVSLRALKYYGSGEREASMSVLIALADYFDVSLDYLTARSDCPDMVILDENGKPTIVVERMVPPGE